MRTLFTALALFLLAFALGIGVLGEWAVMTVAFLSFVILLFFANIDKIEEIRASGTGFAARTRKVLAEAQATVKELQTLSKNVGALTLSLVKRSGRIGGYAPEEEEEIKRSVLKVLDDLGVRQSEVQDVLAEWWKFEELDYAYGILGGSTVPKNASEPQIAEWKQLRRGGLANIPGPGEIEQFLRRIDRLTPERKELLDDYRHYLQHREHRRPEVWLARGSWPPL